ncbi:MAG: HNH/ENDO VII family nuclease, partial [Cyanobacteria bacterium J06649_11]
YADNSPISNIDLYGLQAVRSLTPRVPLRTVHRQGRAITLTPNPKYNAKNAGIGEPPYIMESNPVGFDLPGTTTTTIRESGSSLFTADPNDPITQIFEETVYPNVQASLGGDGPGDNNSGNDNSGGSGNGGNSGGSDGGDGFDISGENKIDRNLLNKPTRRGNAAKFKSDGTSVEIHHEGQNPNGPLREMHWRDHRGAGNDGINHPNKGSASRIDRKQFDKDRRSYWKNEYDNWPEQ